MNILLVASEALPYCKSGGLGDFIWSYSKALVQKGEKASVIIPLYKVIREKHPEVLKELYDNFDFRMSWRTQGCGVFHVVNEGVDFYFTAMDEEFNRDGMYGYGDDNERFASFMMAVNTFVTRHNHFDVVHSNDWQTAVLPLLLTYNPRKIKTVLTIHNPAYQGWALRGDLPYFFNLNTDYYDSGYVRMGDSFNFLKTGIMAADKVNTVSKTHARELMADHNGFGGIGSIIDWCRHNDFSGIVNGLDTEVWDPKTDPHLGQNYDLATVTEGKKVNRDAMLHLLGIDTFFNGPLFSSITRLSSQKGVDRILSVMPLLKSYDAKMIVIGTGEMENDFLYQSLKYPEVYFLKKYDENLAHLLYAASDYFMMPSYFEPCGTSQMIAMRYGTLPIVSNVGGLNDTVKDLSVGDTATGFVFNNAYYDGFYNCFKAANEFYFHEKDRFKKIQANGMEGDYSWSKSADEYLALYRSIFWK
jgi:starch synthase